MTARLKEALGTRTPAWLAQASGIKDASVRKYLKGGQPTIIPAVRLANALGVRLSWLLAGEGPMHGPEEVVPARAPGHHLFDASEADWVFLPHYRFESAMAVFSPIVLETFPVRRDWIRRTLGIERGLWVTEMPTDELPSVAQRGETVVCRNVIGLEEGRAYILGLDGNLIVRRFTPQGFRVDSPNSEVIDIRSATQRGMLPIGVIIARFGLSPIPTKY